MKDCWSLMDEWVHILRLMIDLVSRGDTFGSVDVVGTIQDVHPWLTMKI